VVRPKVTIIINLKLSYHMVISTLFIHTQRELANTHPSGTNTPFYRFLPR
jgi:hypothetical protein